MFGIPNFKLSDKKISIRSFYDLILILRIPSYSDFCVCALSINVCNKLKLVLNCKKYLNFLLSYELAKTVVFFTLNVL